MNFGNKICSPKEEILDRISEIYTDQNIGLVSYSKNPYIQKKIQKPILPPAKKVFVLMVGSHSSGKSSFINWFFGDHIQKTSESIETSTITFVTTGKRQEELKGPATLEAFPFLQQYSSIPNFVDNLSTQVRIPIEDRSSLVTIIDTPGLIDSDRFPFDCQDILLKLASDVSLILIFIHPHEGGFSKQVQDFILKADPKYGSKMKYYLTMADLFTKEESPSKVISLITQNLSKYVTAQSSMKLPQIFIPDLALANKSLNSTEMPENNIDEIATIISDKAKSLVQTSIQQLDSDLSLLRNLSNQILINSKSKIRLYRISTLLGILSIILLNMTLKTGKLFGLGPFYWPLLLFIFLFWVVSYLRKPSQSKIDDIQEFIDSTFPKNDQKLQSYKNDIIKNIKYNLS